MFITESHAFEIAQKRWQKMVAEYPDLDFIDEGIRETVSLLNEQPGVVTAWSCESHAKGVNAKGHLKTGNFYITAVLTEQGLDFIERVFDNFDHTGSRAMLRVTFTKLYLSGLDRKLGFSKERYNTLSLRTILSEKTKDQFIDKLNQAIRKAIQRKELTMSNTKAIETGTIG